MNDLRLHPDRELTELFCALGQNDHFIRLMKKFSERAVALAIWSKDLEKDVHVRQAQGRVGELVDLVNAFDDRHKTRAIQAQVKDTP